MFTISLYPTTPRLLCCPKPNSILSSTWRPRLQLKLVAFHIHVRSGTIGSRSLCSDINLSSTVDKNLRKFRHRQTMIRCVAEEETLISDEQEAAAQQPQEEEESPSPITDQTVSVPVSPSDILTMFFQAEGTMNESAIPAVTKALGETEGISDLKVQVLEGIASVELAKQTTVQATGVASGLVETIQGSGFKLQTLNLSFKDEEDVN